MQREPINQRQLGLATEHDAGAHLDPRSTSTIVEIKQTAKDQSPISLCTIQQRMDTP